MSLFGKNIKYIRQSNGFSQQRFAGLFELSRASIGSYEEGRAEPKIETLIKIANHFNLTVDQLVRGNVDANSITQDHIENESLPPPALYIEDRLSALEQKITHLEAQLNNKS